MGTRLGSVCHATGRVAFTSACLLQLLSAAALKAQGTVVHPTPENLEMGGPVRTVARATTASTDPALNAYAQALRRARRTDSIGTLDGDERLAFGTIWDVAVDSGGRLVVLDHANLEVRVFDRAGVPRTRFGRRGGGPLEFRNPVALWMPAPEHVMVVDASFGGRAFVVPETGAVRLARSHTLMTGATSACGSSESIALYAPVFSQAVQRGMENHVVHRFGADGVRRQSVGSAYRSTVPLVRSDMSEGVVACTADGGTVHALSKLPFVHGIDAAGNSRWTLRLADFTIPRVTEEIDEAGRRSIGLDRDHLDFSFVRRLTALTSDLLLVQVTNSTATTLRQRREWGTLDSYLVRAGSGEAVYVGQHLPLIAAVRGNELIGFQNDPFPRVLKMTLVLGAQR